MRRVYEVTTEGSFEVHRGLVGTRLWAILLGKLGSIMRWVHEVTTEASFEVHRGLVGARLWAILLGKLGCIMRRVYEVATEFSYEVHRGLVVVVIAWHLITGLFDPDGRSHGSNC